MFFVFRQSSQRHIQSKFVFEHIPHRRQVSFAAVDDDQIGKRQSFFQHARIAAAHDFAHRFIIVRPRDRFHLIFPVFFFRRLAIEENDKRRDRIGPVNVRVVKRLDAARRRNAKTLSETFDRFDRPFFVPLDEIKFFFQSNGRVFARQLNKLFFLPFFRLDDGNAEQFAGELAVNVGREDDFFWLQMMRFRIKLTQKRKHFLIRVLVKREDRHVALDQLSLAEEKHLHAHPAFVVRIAEYIAVDEVVEHHFLLFHRHLNRCDLIAVFFRPFKLERFRRLVHFLGQLPLYVFIAAV
ncbi:hypothetical protein TGS27_2530 [Geobacillus stearothermophilus]|nr:hypothetical protein TGS27_2530 [Geobacillus stearothermophilus]